MTTAAVIKDSEYSTIEDLRDAVEGAGVECTAWSERTESMYAAAGADCTSATVLLLFTSTSQRDQQVSVLKGITIDDDGQPLLVGPNWVINSDLATLEVLQPTLGGIIDTSMPQAEDSAVSSADRELQVLGLQMALQQSGAVDEMCEAYRQLGAEITAGAVNAEVTPGNEFLVDVVAEVFDASC